MMNMIRWRDWWKETLKSVPLVLVIIITLYVYGILASIIITIPILYIAHLYDLRWQKRMNLHPIQRK